MGVEYITISALVFLPACFVAVLAYGDPFEEGMSRKAALIAATSWAWPIWHVVAALRLVKYALEPYLTRNNDG